MSADCVRFTEPLELHVTLPQPDLVSLFFNIRRYGCYLERVFCSYRRFNFVVIFTDGIVTLSERGGITIGD